MGKTKSRANGEGDVFPRKNKAERITSYRGAYMDPDGKRRYVSGKNKEEARRALRGSRASTDQGLVFDADNLPVGEYLDRWLADSVSDTVKVTIWRRDLRLADISSVGAVGFEPTLLLRIRILSPVRLPIPPRPRGFGREYNS
jgi:integrase